MKQTPVHDFYNPDLLQAIPLDAEKVIEVGCGSGALAQAYKALSPHAHYTGIDIESSYADMAKARCDQSLNMNIEHAPASFWDEAWDTDCWVFGDTLEHLVEPWQLLMRIRVNLPPNGCVVACIPNMQHWSVIYRLITGELHYEEQGLLDRTHLRWFTKKTIIKMFTDCGYQIDTIKARIFEEPSSRDATRILSAVAQNFGVTQQEDLDLFAPLQYVVKASPRRN